MLFKNKLVKIYRLSKLLGFDPISFFISIYRFPSYFIDYFKFKKSFRGKIFFNPQLMDIGKDGGSIKNEYFLQDLLVARWIHDANPEKHVDIGSRVDGFVSHVASFREVEVFDIRPLNKKIPGISFHQADLMSKDFISAFEKLNYCDSLSCLHAIEHFGLGRYGDPILCNGYEIGIKNMAGMLKSGGNFYLSTPIGKERVEFNANWIFDPIKIIMIAEDQQLELKSLNIINKTNQIKNIDLTDKKKEFYRLSKENYNLAIFTFKKL